MKTVNYSYARAHFADVLDTATDDREEVVVTRQGREDAVIIALSEYESLRETAHLLRSPANARRLHDSIARLSAGQGDVHELTE